MPFSDSKPRQEHTSLTQLEYQQQGQIRCRNERVASSLNENDILGPDFTQHVDYPVGGFYPHGQLLACPSNQVPDGLSIAQDVASSLVPKIGIHAQGMESDKETISYAEQERLSYGGKSLVPPPAGPYKAFGGYRELENAPTVSNTSISPWFASGVARALAPLGTNDDHVHQTVNPTSLHLKGSDRQEDIDHIRLDNSHSRNTSGMPFTSECYTAHITQGSLQPMPTQDPVKWTPKYPTDNQRKQDASLYSCPHDSILFEASSTSNLPGLLNQDWNPLVLAYKPAQGLAPSNIPTRAIEDIAGHPSPVRHGEQPSPEIASLTGPINSISTFQAPSQGCTLERGQVLTYTSDLSSNPLYQQDIPLNGLPSAPGGTCSTENYSPESISLPSTRTRCGWRENDGTVCEDEITYDCSSHLAKHGIKNQSSSTMVTCQSCYPAKPMRRDNMVRHYREVHLRCKRKPKIVGGPRQ